VRPEAHGCRRGGLRGDVDVRDVAHRYLTRLFNWRRCCQLPREVWSLLSEVGDSIWYSGGDRGALLNAIRRLPRLYPLIPEEARGLFLELLRETEEFIEDELGEPLDLVGMVRPHRVTVKVCDVGGRPLNGCHVTVVMGGREVFRGVTGDDGSLIVRLTEGSYTVIAVKHGVDHAYYGLEEVKVAGDVEVTVAAYRAPLTRREVKPSPPTLHAYKVSLPPLPLSWRRGVDVHEKWMQMAFRAQLEKLGKFLGKRLIGVRHTFTGFKSWHVLDEIRNDLDLRPLIVTNEMDIIALTEDNELIGFELKSLKCLQRGDYGIEQAKHYYLYGIDYVYLVHREMDEDVHREILKKVNSTTLGYATYSPDHLQILRIAQRNPYNDDEGVEKRGSYIKRNFHLAGGTTGPIL